MERKLFLRQSLGLLGAPLIIKACKKAEEKSDGTTTVSGCMITPAEVEGPYPYPGGEITNPLKRIDITDGQTGVPLSVEFLVVNANNNCAPVPDARVDIWHCNKDGYYSGYGGQPGILGTQNNVGKTWLRGYQLTDSLGKLSFTTIFPGWYGGRATHIHMEIYVNTVLKKIGQITFPETISDLVHVSGLYAAHGINTTRNANDSIFNNSVTDLTNETVALTGSVAEGYKGTYTIGLAL